jgi:hypothetical protein
MYRNAKRANQAVERVHGRRGGRIVGTVRSVAKDLGAHELRKRLKSRHAGADGKLRHQGQQHGQQPREGDAAVQHRG